MNKNSVWRIRDEGAAIGSRPFEAGEATDDQSDLVEEGEEEGVVVVGGGLGHGGEGGEDEVFELGPAGEEEGLGEEGVGDAEGGLEQEAESFGFAGQDL